MLFPKLILVAYSVMQSTCLFAAAKNDVQLLFDQTSNWPPFSFPEKKKMAGIYPGVVAMAVTKFNYELKYLDVTEEKSAHAGKGKMLEEKEKAICAGPSNKNWIPENEKFIWTGPIIESKDELWFKAGKKIEAKEFSELKKTENRNLQGLWVSYRASTF